MKAYHFGDRIAIPTEKPRMTKVADYNDAECDLLFKFKKSHLRDMVKLLRFPEQVTFSNRVTLTGEEVMLRGLFEMNSRETQYKISRHFGRDWTTQSRAWSFFIRHMYSGHHHLVHDSLSWWHRQPTAESCSYTDSSITSPTHVNRRRKPQQLLCAYTLLAQQHQFRPDLRVTATV